MQIMLIKHVRNETKNLQIIVNWKRAYKKARRTNQKRDIDRYKKLQKEVQYQIRKTNKDYLQNTVSQDFKENSKKFWAYVKSKGQEITGVAPL